MPEQFGCPRHNLLPLQALYDVFRCFVSPDRRWHISHPRSFWCVAGVNTSKMPFWQILAKWQAISDSKPGWHDLDTHTKVYVVRGKAGTQRRYVTPGPQYSDFTEVHLAMGLCRRCMGNQGAWKEMVASSEPT